MSLRWREDTNAMDTSMMVITSTTTIPPSASVQNDPAPTPSFPPPPQVHRGQGASAVRLSIQVAHVLSFFAGRFSYLARKYISNAVSRSRQPSSIPVTNRRREKRPITADSRTIARNIYVSAPQHLFSSGSSGEGRVCGSRSSRTCRTQRIGHVPGLLPAYRLGFRPMATCWKSTRQRLSPTANDIAMLTHHVSRPAQRLCSAALSLLLLTPSAVK